jgi:hypothetical protein
MSTVTELAHNLRNAGFYTTMALIDVADFIVVRMREAKSSVLRELLATADNLISGDKRDAESVKRWVQDKLKGIPAQEIRCHVCGTPTKKTYTIERAYTSKKGETILRFVCIGLCAECAPIGKL